MTRCDWAHHELAVRYHDEEWGVPVHDDVRHFEMIVLEGAQAGLSWDTILKKREAYRKAFKGFDPATVARFGSRQIEAMLKAERHTVVRHRGKLESAVSNAKAFLEVQDEFGSFDAFVWAFVDGAPIVNRWKRMTDVPAVTDEATALSKALKKRGFSFVGPTICYAYMQACGLVNDHLVGCFRYGEV